MTHILISFLGKGNPDSNKRYRPTTYDFGSGRKEKTEFFGLGLTRHLRPDRLIILGTTGSTWDVLLFSLGVGADYEEAMLAVTESADADRTTQAELDYLEAAVSQRLGLPAWLCLIPYGRELGQQIDILRAMAAYISAGDQVSLDVTHGLRHLPMLALVSAGYLQAAYRRMSNGCSRSWEI